MQKLPKNIPFPETPSGFGEAFIKDCRENPNNLSNWFRDALPSKEREHP